jgi:hypothetical protein
MSSSTVAEFVELDVFGTVELERSWKNGSRAVPNTPLTVSTDVNHKRHGASCHLN